MRKLEYVPHEYACKGEAGKGGRQEKDGKGWPESAGVDGFVGGYERMSGGRACMWAVLRTSKPRRRYGTLEA